MEYAWVTNIVIIAPKSDRVETIDIPRLNAKNFRVMILTILRLISLITSALKLCSDLALENLALRQQLAILNRSSTAK
jgi:hypothetical protein